MVGTLLAASLASPPALGGEHGGFILVPFGVSVYLHGKPARGVVYSATQAAGIGVLSWGAIEGNAALDETTGTADEAALQRAQLIAGIGLAAFATSYVASVVDGSRLHEAETTAAGVRRFDRWLAEARR
jgi:hypothetical protein